MIKILPQNHTEQTQKVAKATIAKLSTAVKDKVKAKPITYTYPSMVLERAATEMSPEDYINARAYLSRIERIYSYENVI